MESLEVLAMVLCAAAAVWVAFTKCPCQPAADDAAAGYDPSELPTR
jgi:hypothetical protein